MGWGGGATRQACRSRGCRFLEHSDGQTFGGYCCKKCRTNPGAHGKKCEMEEKPAPTWQDGAAARAWEEQPAPTLEEPASADGESSSWCDTSSSAGGHLTNTELFVRGATVSTLQCENDKINPFSQASQFFNEAVSALDSSPAVVSSATELYQEIGGDPFQQELYAQLQKALPGSSFTMIRAGDLVGVGAGGRKQARIRAANVAFALAVARSPTARRSALSKELLDLAKRLHVARPSRPNVERRAGDRDWDSSWWQASSWPRGGSQQGWRGDAAGWWASGEGWSGRAWDAGDAGAEPGRRAAPAAEVADTPAQKGGGGGGGAWQERAWGAPPPARRGSGGGSSSRRGGGAGSEATSEQSTSRGPSPSTTAGLDDDDNWGSWGAEDAAAPQDAGTMHDGVEAMSAEVAPETDAPARGGPPSAGVAGGLGRRPATPQRRSSQRAIMKPTSKAPPPSQAPVLNMSFFLSGEGGAIRPLNCSIPLAPPPPSWARTAPATPPQPPADTAARPAASGPRPPPGPPPPHLLRGTEVIYLDADEVDDSIGSLEAQLIGVPHKITAAAVSQLRYTQRSITGEFEDGKTLQRLIEDLQDERVNPLTHDVLILDAAQSSCGTYYMIFNNRRLFCLKRFQKHMPTDVVVRMRVYNLPPELADPKARRSGHVRPSKCPRIS